MFAGRLIRSRCGINLKVFLRIVQIRAGNYEVRALICSRVASLRRGRIVGYLDR
jgi:hypothetical protein